MPPPQTAVPIPQGATLDQAPAAAVPIPQGAALDQGDGQQQQPPAYSPEAVASGVVKQIGGDVNSLANLAEAGINKLPGGKNIVSDQTLASDRAAVQKDTQAPTTPGEDIGKVVGSGMEWLYGDAELMALAKFAKVAKFAPGLIELADKYPTLAKLLFEGSKGAVIGGAQGAVQGSAEGKDVGDATEKGAIGGAAGGGIGGFLEGVTGSELAQKFVNKSLAVTARDVAHGNPGKALIDEGIISPRTGSLGKFLDAIKSGKPLNEALEAAGGRVEQVADRLNELSPQLESVLKKSTARIDPNDTILKPIMKASTEIHNNAMVRPEVAQATEVALDAWADRVKTLVGTSPITPEQAVKLKQDLGKTMNFTKNAAVDDILEMVDAQVYGSLKNAVHTAVPEAAALDERMSNLMVAWNKLDPTKAGTLPAQELAAKGPGIMAGNFWDIPQRVIDEIGRILPGTHAAVSSPITRAGLGLAGENAGVEGADVNVPESVPFIGGKHILSTEGAAQAPAPELPGVQEGFTRFAASDGSIHDVPTEHLDKAKKIDPGLQVQTTVPRFATH